MKQPEQITIFDIFSTYYILHKTVINCLVKVLSLLKACFDLILGSSLSMKIQITGVKILKIWGSKPHSGRSKFSNYSYKSGYLLF